MEANTAMRKRPSIRVMKADFLRPWTIYCCKDSTISYGPRGDHEAKLVPAAVPVYSVEDEQAARALQVMLCSQGLERWHYSLPDYRYTPLDLPHVYRAFKDAHQTRSGWVWQRARERSIATYGNDDASLARWALSQGELDNEDLADSFKEIHALDKWLERIGLWPGQRVVPSDD